MAFIQSLCALLCLTICDILIKVFESIICYGYTQMLFELESTT